MQNTNTNLNTKISSFIEKVRLIIPYSLPIKLILSSLLGILGGAGLLGILSDYATYYYAYEMGFRAPFESVPYLKATIAFSSLFLLLSSALVFSITILLLKSIQITILKLPYTPQLLYKQIYKIGVTPELIKSKIPKFYNYIKSNQTLNNISLFFQDKDLKKFNKLQSDYEKFHKRSVAIKLSICLATGLFMLAISYGLIYFNPKTMMGDEELFMTIAFIYGFTSGFVLNFHKARWPISFTLTIFYFSFCIFNIFQPNQYAKFLRLSGYGGGTLVQLQCKDDRLHDKISTSSTSLMLRTNNTYILFLQKDRAFLEIPLEEIISTSYRIGGSNNYNYSLPK
ncbi:hypothetical protein [Janthinobacterium sp. BJB426]|uniref:hypothetical protein n=1 Tax=Janthinobacterium sp. BJB426 TaxID=2048010 RepID=UPI0013053E5A|nr:hypothetical protein [Janthinobacterium sp. BJB426]